MGTAWLLPIDTDARMNASLAVAFAFATSFATSFALVGARRSVELLAPKLVGLESHACSSQRGTKNPMMCPTELCTSSH